MRRHVLALVPLVLLVSLAVGAVVVTRGPAAAAWRPAAIPGAAHCTPMDRARGTPGAAITGTPSASGDCGTPAAGTPVAADVAAVTNVEIRLVDIAFLPADVTIPANTDVTLSFVNEGVAVHDFKIAHPDIFSGYLGPGHTSQVVVNLPPGTYAFVCTIPGHARSGMSGFLTAQE